MWSASRGSSNPGNLKSILSNKSDMYSGFQQQDAQEFLSILLDTLHEDLNQGDIKRTFVMPDGDGKCDESVAGKSWEFHKQRNNSYFVDNFMGQYKSKVACLECGKVSITFDPYMYLSLPLAKDRTPVEYYFLSLASPSIGRCKVYAHLPVTANMLLKKISVELKLNQDKLSMFTVSKSTVLTTYKSCDMVLRSHLSEGQLIVQENRNSSDGAVAIKVMYAVSDPLAVKACSFCNTEGELKRCLRCRKVSYCNQDCQKKHYKIHKSDCKSSPQTVGLPLVLYLKQKDLKYDKFISIAASANIYLNFAQKKKMKFSYHLKVTDDLGTVSNLMTVGPNSKAIDFVSVANQDLCFMLIYDNSANNIIAEHDFEIFDHESLRSRQPKSSLGDCFESFTQEERLPDTELWRCPRCNKLQKATKQISLYSCPNYLIVHLKRFQAKNIIMFDKVDKMIAFPVQNLDLCDYSVRRSNVASDYYVYDLYGVANHYGSLYRGHYTAYSKLSGPGNAWREFDDRTVTDVNENSVQSQAAYVLFYKKRKFSEEISKGILSSEDEEEYFDAESGNVHKDSDTHSDNSCYYEAAKVSDDEISGFSSNINISTSSSLTKGDNDTMEEEEENESQKTTEGSSSSDVSCEYIKVETADLQPTLVEGDVNNDGLTEAQESDTDTVCLGAIQVNFEDELD